MWYKDIVDFNTLVGRTLETVAVGVRYDVVTFNDINGDMYQLVHFGDCCENVFVENVDGDLQNLIGVPILQAEEMVSDDLPAPESYTESYTWTVYTLTTIKGSVTIRWLGTSNGYYSERVSFIKIPAKVEEKNERV